MRLKRSTERTLSLFPEPENTDRYVLHVGNVLEVLPTLPENRFDGVLCDPPYHLTQNSRRGSVQAGDSGKTPFGRHGVCTDRGFMGQTWDGGDIAFRPETWRAVLRVMKPGSYLLAFGGSRTFHRLAVALEDAGFVLVDTLMWLYGTGFPKSLDVSKAIDKHLGVARPVVGKRKHPTLKNTDLIEEAANAAHGKNFWRREWDVTLPGHADSARWNGYGTALKPAYEPILLCRKPGEKTYAENALKWGCGALNIDGARIPVSESEGERPLREVTCDPDKNGMVYAGRRNAGGGFDGGSRAIGSTSEGRWPANAILDEEAAAMLNTQAGPRKSGAMPKGTLRRARQGNAFGRFPGVATHKDIAASVGNASRFFYVSKVSTKERQAGVTSGEPRYAHGTTLRRIENSEKVGNDHPTLKPIDLTRYLANLILPPSRGDDSRRLLVPFSGAGSEMIGALQAGWDTVLGIEQSEHYAEIARKRLIYWIGG